MSASGNSNADSVVATFFQLELEAECEVAVLLFGLQSRAALLANQDSIFGEVAFGVPGPTAEVFAVEQVRPLT